MTCCSTCTTTQLNEYKNVSMHAGVIHKLNNFGITGELNSWFSSYLSERKQRVVLDGFTSSYGGLQAGVPQGSVLGPLLFLLMTSNTV